jgi:hypothetical protein
MSPQTDRIVMISACRKCPHLHLWGPLSGDYFFCNNTVEKRRIDTDWTSEIPEWCSLERTKQNGGEE